MYINLLIQAGDGGLAELKDRVARSAERDHGLTLDFKGGLVIGGAHQPCLGAGLEVVSVSLAYRVPEFRVQGCKKMISKC